ncbi:MAG: lipid-A-disaccharide synthase [Deltaproteobacteria bacterium]|jgi:lipid-A-disaccharide synthase|nr:lipid-A-disaccharide synthase [Deltaproteobacteria bacterium]
MPAGKIKVMICAGEESGDLHGAALIRAAAERKAPVFFFGLGGDRMRKEGCELLAHSRETAVMGLKEVLGSLRRILALGKRLSETLLAYRPDALVLIDSPDFNFRLARIATAAGIPVVYYICPQVWAWRQGRIRFLAKNSKRRCLILPFEPEFYRERGVSADFVGHPLLDELRPLSKAEARAALAGPAAGLSPAASGYASPAAEAAEPASAAPLAPRPVPEDGRLLAVLPGSRAGVFARLAPPLLEAAGLLAASRPDLRVAVALAPTLPASLARRHLARVPGGLLPRLHVFTGRSQEILNAADAALLASGTSSAEASVLGAPAVVCYRTGFASFLLARLLVKTRFISIPNLILGRRLLPELIQGAATPEGIVREAAALLDGGEARERALAGLAEVSRAFGGPGASRRVLDIVLEEAGGKAL